MSDIPILKKKSEGEVKFLIKQKKRQYGIDFGLTSQVIWILDISSSMDFRQNRFFDSGIIQAAADLLMPFAMSFDDDGEVPVYAFDHGVQVLQPLTAANLPGYVNRYVPSRTGGTNYAPFINKVCQDAEAGDPIMAIVFTDGDNSDHREARQAMIRASGLPIFWQFIGIQGKGRVSFNFLEELDEMPGRLIDNAGFSPLPMYDVDDAGLYDALLSEYAGYPALAQQAGLLDANLHWDGRRHNVPTGGRQQTQRRKKRFGIF